MAGTDCQGTMCILTHCLGQFTSCMADSQCRDILNCLGACEPTDAECGFTCGMGSEAGKNPHFVALLACMVEHDCFERYAESGACLAGDSEALQTTDYGLVEGDWWTVYGQSCGQTDSHGEWAGSYDWYPCSHARLGQGEQGWVNNTTYCPGSDSVCSVRSVLTLLSLTSLSGGSVGDGAAGLLVQPGGAETRLPPVRGPRHPSDRGLEVDVDLRGQQLVSRGLVRL